eukprot:scaffold4760_cov113-Isochrysis_galbana.AAC.9
MHCLVARDDPRLQRRAGRLGCNTLQVHGELHLVLRSLGWAQPRRRARHRPPGHPGHEWSPRVAGRCRAVHAHAAARLGLHQSTGELTPWSGKGGNTDGGTEE